MKKPHFYENINLLFIKNLTFNIKSPLFIKTQPRFLKKSSVLPRVNIQNPRVITTRTQKSSVLGTFEKSGLFIVKKVNFSYKTSEKILEKKQGRLKKKDIFLVQKNVQNRKPGPLFSQKSEV